LRKKAEKISKPSGRAAAMLVPGIEGGDEGRGVGVGHGHS